MIGSSMDKRLYYFLRKLYTVLVNTGLTGIMLWQFQMMWVSTFNDLLDRVFSHKGNILMLMLYAAVIIIFFYVWGGFKIGYYKCLNVVLSQLLGIVASNIFLAIQMTLMVAKLPEMENIISHIVMLTIYDCLICIPYTTILAKVYLKLFKPLRMILINGTTDNHLTQKVQAREDKYLIQKSIGYSELDWDRLMVELVNYDAVLLNEVPQEFRERLLRYCYVHSIRVYFTPEISDIFVRGTDSIQLFDTPIFLSKNIGLSYGEAFFKRLFDIIASVAGLLVVSPIMLITAVCIKLEDGGPVIYRQRRCTINGKQFWILKFRSMVVGAESEGEVIPAREHDDRITKVGKIIRRVHIDELPQLVNVLKGQMSIVGPRPERVEHVEKYSMEIPEFYYRMKVRGGLTGYAQVYGKYNTSAEDKLKMDLQYIVNYSFLLDLQIILQTFKVLFQKEKTEGFGNSGDK